MPELWLQRELSLELPPFLSFGSAKTEVALFLAREGRIAPPLNGRLNDEFGGRIIYVRGAAKIMAHLMFGVLALTADQIRRGVG
ncbi:MAG: hypothetical protein HYX27_04735 [Acidobacteria bacterium]|nr:hypothetical protein [Acidobacteriota bacterium]